VAEGKIARQGEPRSLPSQGGLSEASGARAKTPAGAQ